MENAPAGWYPNPEPGPRLRYWDGSRWTEQARNQIPGSNLPPVSPDAAIADETQPAVPRRNPAPVTHDAISRRPLQPDVVPSAAASPPRDQRRAPVLAVVAFTLTLTLGLVMLGWFLTRQDDAPPTQPSASGTISPPLERTCWSIANTSASVPTSQPTRVAGGGLSFPRLRTPWGPVTRGTVLSASTDTAGQSFVTEQKDPGFRWVASANVAEVDLGDRDASPQDAAETMSRCLRITMYGRKEEQIQPKETVARNASTTVDGHRAWVRESTLAVDIPRFGFRTTEEFTLVMVQTSPGRLAMYYASVPQNQAAAAKQARAVVKQLLVD